MNNDLEFQMVCCDCGSLAGASRGTIGALRDLAVRAHVPPTSRQQLPTKDSCSELVSLHKELQRLRQVRMAESVTRTGQ